MVTTPVLHLPNFTQEFVIETDASNEGIGYVLMQHGHPIAYFSQKMGPQLQNSSAYFRELHALIESNSNEGCQKWNVKCHFATLNSVSAPLTSVFAPMVGAKMGCHFNNSVFLIKKYN